MTTTWHSTETEPKPEEYPVFMGMDGELVKCVAYNAADFTALKLAGADHWQPANPPAPPVAEKTEAPGMADAYNHFDDVCELARICVADVLEHEEAAWHIVEHRIRYFLDKRQAAERERIAKEVERLCNRLLEEDISKLIFVKCLRALTAAPNAKTMEGS